MKVFTHNFNPHSNSGPNKFTRQLFKNLIKNKHIQLSNQQDADIEFFLIQQQFEKVKPSILRLDGIYFNSEQNYDALNKPIHLSYRNADAVIFQSKFNKELTENWFGKHNNSFIIHNAADENMIKRANPAIFNKLFDENDVVWSCASSWRPHKRLHENIQYFLEKAPENAKFAIAGDGISNEEVLKYKELLNRKLYFLGKLEYQNLLSLYKRSKNFIHLAYMDHCPNVVVDAQAAGCEIVCSSSGGTKEVVTKGIIVQDGYTSTKKPLKLYHPPDLDFSNIEEVERSPMQFLDKTSEDYLSVFRSVA